MNRDHLAVQHITVKVHSKCRWNDQLQLAIITYSRLLSHDDLLT